MVIDSGEPAAPAVAADRATPYAWYALGLLFLVYVLNFVDRQIITILAPGIKADLHLDDSDIGFLYGTAFAVFYALFGVPLGRLADSWSRVRLLTIGLALWSGMTAISGLSRTGTQLAGARMGVGIGEATASPAAYSLISDLFPKRMRGTALAIYSAGLYFGGGVSLMIGGAVVASWDRAYPGGRRIRSGRLAGGIHGGGHPGAAAGHMDCNTARARSRPDRRAGNAAGALPVSWFRR